MAACVTAAVFLCPPRRIEKIWLTKVTSVGVLASAGRQWATCEGVKSAFCKDGNVIKLRKARSALAASRGRRAMTCSYRGWSGSKPFFLVWPRIYPTLFSGLLQPQMSGFTAAFIKHCDECCDVVTCCCGNAHTGFPSWYFEQSLHNLTLTFNSQNTHAACPTHSPASLLPMNRRTFGLGSWSDNS